MPFASETFIGSTHEKVYERIKKFCEDVIQNNINPSDQVSISHIITPSDGDDHKKFIGYYGSCFIFYNKLK